MAVMIGSARHDENGKISGGKAGDQTGEEVSRQNWYLHSKGWVLIRAKTAAAREAIAKNMEAACDNPMIGYDQSQNTTLYNVAKTVGYDCAKVKTACETDCARLVRVCVLYAGINCSDFYTASEAEALKATGQFEILTEDKYCTSSVYLMRGDILVTRTKGHTVVVLSNGSKAAAHTTLKKGDKGDEVKQLQGYLNQLGLKDDAGKPLEIDGSYGAKTKAVVTKFQKENNLTASGTCTQATWKKIDAQLKTSGRTVLVTTDLYCRQGPAVDYLVIKTLRQGTTYTKLRESTNGWFYLKEPAGWASGSYLSYK